jgi:hypothetical protein
MLPRSRAFILTTAAGVLALACYLAALAVFCQFTLHVPRRLPATPPGTAWRTVSIRAFDGVQLIGWFVPPAVSNGNCVIVLHGIGDSRQGSAGYAPMFLEQGYSVLLPDSRGHGASGGELVTYGLWEKYDVLDWARWLQQHECRALYGLGESLGASVLIQAAALGGGFHAIAADSAYADLQAIAETRVDQMFHLPPLLQSSVPWFLVHNSITFARYRYGVDLRQAAPLDSMRRTSTPTLLIHGLEDSRTPYWNSQALARASAQSVLWLVPNAEHTRAYAAAPNEFRRRVLAWFAAH